jgi:hypothetical protein
MRLPSFLSMVFFAMFMLYNAPVDAAICKNACLATAPKSKADCSASQVFVKADRTDDSLGRCCNQCVLNCALALCVPATKAQCASLGRAFVKGNPALGICCDQCGESTVNCDLVKCANVDKATCDAQHVAFVPADPKNGKCCNTCDCKHIFCPLLRCVQGMEQLPGHCCPTCKCPPAENCGINGEYVTSPGEKCSHCCVKPHCSLAGRPQYDPVSKCNKCVCHSADCPPQHQCPAGQKSVTLPNECCPKCVPDVKVCLKDCVKGTHCVNGDCVPDVKPCVQLCVKGTHCVNGDCVPDVKPHPTPKEQEQAPQKPQKHHEQKYHKDL